MKALDLTPLLIADERLPEGARAALSAAARTFDRSRSFSLRESAARELVDAFDLTCDDVGELLAIDAC
jgi:hypothetical protein